MELFDTLRGQKATLEIPTDRPLTMYVCGVTPYDTTHIGHARTFLIFDVLQRYLRSQGATVRYCQNTTDVDDPLFARAKRDGIEWADLAARETAQFVKDCADMHLIAPDFFPKASDFIPQMIPIIARLIELDQAYAVDGHVYFSVATEPTYGEMARLGGYAELLATANERGNDPDDMRKRDPLDFVLWQTGKDDEPKWASPWGMGRPGWHIECTAMSTHYLGNQLDIHGGGRDLIFPHHPSEIVQTEPVTGIRPFARFWVHGGLAWLDGAKMSKSLGNLVFVRHAVVTHGPDVLRWYLMSFPYRDDFNYIEADVQAIHATIDRMRQALGATSGLGAALDLAEQRAEFLAALADSLDTPRALVALAAMIDAIRAAAAQGASLTAAQDVLRDCATIFGFPAAGAGR